MRHLPILLGRFTISSVSRAAQSAPRASDGGIPETRPKHPPIDQIFSHSRRASRRAQAKSCPRLLPFAAQRGPNLTRPMSPEPLRLLVLV